MAIPGTYCKFECCKNCGYIFVREERKAPTEYYCEWFRHNSGRPLCGSIKMGESEASSKNFSWEKWEEWKEEHLIEDELGKCKNYYER